MKSNTMSTNPESFGASLEALIKIGHNITVLYVEDDPVIRQEFTHFLNRFFFKVDTAANGKEGLNTALSYEYDLIISDIEMPYMNGLDMIEKIKEQKPHQATLLVSAHHEITMMQRSIEIGVDGYLFKPILPNQTIALLHKVVSHIEQEKENIRYKIHLEKLVEAKSQKLLQLYTIDRISGLYTRGKFEEDLLSRSDVSLALFKINDFKSLNDFYGYELGDSIIRHSADFLRERFSILDNANLYRISGSHFALLTPMPSDDLEKFAILTNQIFENNQIKIESEFIHLQMAIAIVPHNEAVSLSKGDIALREAQRTGKVVVYHQDPLKDQLRSKKLKYKEEIKRALRENRFVPFYQPIIDNISKKIIKYEALARLILPDGKIITPEHFLNIAKETKTYGQISHMVIKKAMDDFKDSECNVSINLSIDDIKNSFTQKFLFAQIEAFPEPNRLVFELLESEGIDSYEELGIFLNRLKHYGCQIAIDDFGSGYSNFEHLARLNIDYIKIDGSLIMDIESGVLSQTIVELITSFAKKMEIKTIAEFVSNRSIESMIDLLEVNESQGYLFGQPVPYDLSMRFIQSL